MTYEERKRFIVNFLYYGIMFLIAFYAVKWGWKFLTPFVIGFAVTFFLKPVVNAVNVWFKIKRPIAAVLVIMGFYAVAGALIAFAGIEIFIVMQNIVGGFPAFYTEELVPLIETLLNNIQRIAVNIDPTIRRVVEEYSTLILQKLGEAVSAVSVWLISFLSSVATSIPGLFIDTLFMIIATVFMSVDYYEITYFITKQMSLKQIALLYETEVYAKTAIVQFIKSYTIIIFLTFADVGIGLWLLGVKMPFVVSRIIAVFDVLPVLGTGGILIPWAVISIATGDVLFGIGMFIVYLVVTVIRNVAEPKIVGRQVGLHPVATLVAMFLGAKLLGIIGLFGFPIGLVILRQLNESGRIKLFK